MNRIAVFACVTMCVVAGCKKSGTTITPDIDIWKAAAEGRTDIVAQRLDEGADINASFVAPGVPGSGGTPLHLAALTDQRDVVVLLIERRADVNVRADDEHGGTPMHWGAAAGNMEVVRLLLEARAKINATDKNGYTPMDALWVDPDTRRAEKEHIEAFLKQRGGKKKRG